MPEFSRAQLHIVLLVATLLLGLYAWRGNPGRLSAPTQTVAPNQVFVEIAGEVAHPGIYAFSSPPTLLEVWRQAGGPEPAPQSDVTLPPETRLEVRAGGDYVLERLAGERLLTLGLSLDLNTATAEDLEALPGVGPALAQRILQHRQSQGPYKQIEDLLRVPGIGNKKLEQLRPLITVVLR